MGLNVVPLKDLTPDESKVFTLDLLKNMDPNDVQNEKSRGQIVVELTYKPFKEDEVPDDAEDSNTLQKAPEGTPAGGGLLVIIVHEAEDVEGKYHTNPYVRLLFRGEERKTKVSYFWGSLLQMETILFECKISEITGVTLTSVASYHWLVQPF